MTACVCDHDPAQVYVALRPLARTAHRCDECGTAIRPGERYERVAGLWEGRWDHFNTCVHCLVLRDACAACGCFCWEHHNLAQNIADHLDWAELKAGQRFALLRLIAEHPRWGRRP